MDYVYKLIQSSIQLHKPVSYHFFTGTWANLQYNDSCIAGVIINQFTNSGQVVLSVHGNFIVETLNVPKLLNLMEDCYEKRFHLHPKIVKQ